MYKFTQKPFFLFNNENNYSLYCVDYCPVKPNGIAFCFLQPIGIERNVIDAVQVNLARTLASSGIRVLRFDYYGTGDSEGFFSDITFQTLMSDIKVAVNYLKDNGCEKIGLFGLRFGAFLASEFAEKELFDYLILAAPVVNAYEFVMHELRQTISMQTVLFKKIAMDRNQIIQNILDQKQTVVNDYDLANINGFPLTRKFLVSIRDIDIQNDKKNFKNNCLVINIDKKINKQPKEVEKLISTYKECKSISYIEIIEKQLLWIHGNILIKTCKQLNNQVSDWIENVNGNNC